MHPLLDTDVTAPRSRHSVHVTDRRDLVDVDDWSRDALFRAVRAADERDEVVVVDHGRSLLYLAERSTLTYRPPRLLRIAADPVLYVTSPTRYKPTGPATEPLDSRVVSPQFDILIPAFDWEDLTEADLPPRRATRQTAPGGAGTGSPG
jgi:hypothetical protein